ncbi:MAG: hypothetical protein IK015_08200 [Treponema sp.]|nr:hypothetical protein [Treponema sp.]
MKKSILFLALAALFLSAQIFGQDDYYESKPLYSLPKILDGQNSDASVLAKKNSEQAESKPVPSAATIKRVQVEETKGTLLATESGLKKINANGKTTTLWKEGSVQQILPVENSFYFITSKGILYTNDLQNFELRNNGLPTYIIKKFKKGETSHETHAQDLKDLAFNPLNPAEMVTATKERVYLTRDGGLNWTNIGSASLRTNGIKAVAVASMKTSTPGQTETVVYMAHSILGFWYYKPDAAKPDWLDANKGLECSDPNNSSDEVSDILPVVAQDDDKNQWCEIFLSQTFMPRIYHYDAAANKCACIYKGSEPCDTIDSLWQNGSALSFIAPGKIGSFDMTNNTASELNGALQGYISEFTKSRELVNAAWIPAENARGLKIGGGFNGAAGGILLNELWLLDSGKILSPYAAKIDGQKSLYVPAYQAHLPGGFEKFKKLILDNKLNSLVIDMKDDYGLMRFDAQDPLLTQKGVVSKYALDLDKFVKTFKEENIYLIARIVVFKDRNLSNYNNGQYAVWDKKYNRQWQGISGTETLEDGTTQTRYYDEHWVDPFCPEVWEYNVAIAKELIARGFDEIQFDYIRFPTDGQNLYNASYRWQTAGMDKEGALRSFLSYARENIDAPIGIDIYGANGWYRSGTRTGQDVETLAQYVDVICPMFYPSHFEHKFMNYYPNEERPYRIYYYGTYRNTVIARDRVVVRPWVQAFFLNVPYDRQFYDKEYVLKEVFGVRDSVDRGYMFWNNVANYVKISPDPGDAEYTGASPEASSNYRKPAIGPKGPPISFYASQKQVLPAKENNLSALDSVLQNSKRYDKINKEEGSL